MALNYVTFRVHFCKNSRYEYNLSNEKEKEPRYVILCYLFDFFAYYLSFLFARTLISSRTPYAAIAIPVTIQKAFWKSGIFK